MAPIKPGSPKPKPPARRQAPGKQMTSKPGAKAAPKLTNERQSVTVNGKTRTTMRTVKVDQRRAADMDINTRLRTVGTQMKREGEKDIGQGLRDKYNALLEKGMRHFDKQLGKDAAAVKKQQNGSSSRSEAVKKAWQTRKKNKG